MNKKALFHNGKFYKPVKCGDKSDNAEFESANFVCPDCGAKLGEEHDPGCDQEICPICGEQLISCGCFMIAEYELAVQALKDIIHRAKKFVDRDDTSDVEAIVKKYIVNNNIDLNEL